MTSSLQTSAEHQQAAFSLFVKPGGELRGEIDGNEAPCLPGDKSLSHRSALLCAMAEGNSCINNFLVSGVTQAMLQSLRLLGVPWELSGKTLKVSGIGLHQQSEASPVTLQCGNSATTLRLLAGGLSAWNRPAILDGTPGLRRRPMGRIIAPLQRMGVRISGVDNCAPLTLSASSHPLTALDYSLPVASAQVKSCLLIAALAARGRTRLDEPGPSRDHTERMLRAMGVDVSNGLELKADGQTIYWTSVSISKQLTLAPLDITIPGDMSAAAFLMVGALVTPGSQVIIRRVGTNPTRTGLLETLQEMGADISVKNLSEEGGEPVGDVTVKYSQLQGIRVSGERVVRMIDEFPAFAVAAAFSKGTTIVEDAEELRHKESDRISSLGTELRALGVDFRETADGFSVIGEKKPRGGIAKSHGDHRLAMSLALIGLAAENPVEVIGAEMINESFPSFIDVLRFLGADISNES